MTRKNCERINAIKTVNSYGFKNVGTLLRRTTFFLLNSTEKLY